MKRCIFFDRDGIINRSPGSGYVERWEDFHLRDGFVEAFKIADMRGYCSVMISNQQCVGKGIVKKEYLDWMHDQLQAELQKKSGIQLLDMYYCPHLAAENCECRKPKPGMILAAAAKHDIDLNKSFMVGDRESDVVTGKAAGCRTILVAEDMEETDADYQTDSIDELPALFDRIL